jgi:PIN domain nuclease of toxin-antitoxin system
MRILLDTQILIWFQLNDPQLPERLRTLIEDPQHDVLVSDLSFIEITIKQTINRLPEFAVLTDELAAVTERDGFIILPLARQHIAAYRKIPFHNDHRDPFDRLILATALAENIPVISADEKFQRYSDLVAVIS